MKKQSKAMFTFLFVLIYISFYFFWVIAWRDNEAVLTWGGNILSILGFLIGTYWLLSAFKKSRKAEKPFWLLLAFGTFSYVVAEMLWISYENFLKIEIPYPGSPDLFYMMQIVFYLAAFAYQLIKNVRKQQMIKFIFDVLIVMIVASTFSWHFLLSPIIEEGDVSLYPLLMSLAYPIGDLALLLGAISIYFGTDKKIFNKTLFLISLGLLVQIFADSAYLYLVSADQYNSGSLIDPLFILAILLVGSAGLIYKSPAEEQQKAELEEIQQLDFFRLALPYANVVILFIFMSLRSTGIDIVTVGSGVSILLVIGRQILVIRENQYLLRQYHLKAEELEISEQRYKSLFEYHPDAVYSLDLKGRFESVNAACAALFGYEKKELIGLPSESFTAPSRQNTKAAMLTALADGKPHSYEIPMRNRLGNLYHMSVTNIPILVRDKLVGIFGIGKDITENKKNEEKIQFLAYHDSLTGLANRTFFAELLSKAVEEAEVSNELFAVMFIDLDQFKNINDTLGHDIGDRLLQSVASRLQDCVTENDTVARQGGDEFTLLIKDIHHTEDAVEAAERILLRLNEPHLIEGYEITSTPSIGIAVYPLVATTPVALMKQADIAMYQVKANGKGHFQLFKETK